MMSRGAMPLDRLVHRLLAMMLHRVYKVREQGCSSH